jgi:hypothetical protein
MGVKTTMTALSYAANHFSGAAKAGQDVNSLHYSILSGLTEVIGKMKTLVGEMTTGDGNIATVNAQITALS